MAPDQCPPTSAPVYACGCSMIDVGQAFHEGVLVCPQHGTVTAPYEHPQAPFAGRVRLELLVEAPSRAEVQTWLDALTETLLHEPLVRGLDRSEPL